MAIILFIVAFLLQLAGVVLIVLEIRDDLRAAREIQERPAGGPTEIVEQTATTERRIGGLAGAFMAQQGQAIDTFREFTAERLSGGLLRRILGVVLFVTGAAIDLAANLISL